jgi:hypothetical protein
LQITSKERQASWQKPPQNNMENNMAKTWQVTWQNNMVKQH